jgi:hypothetical protein
MLVLLVHREQLIVEAEAVVAIMGLLALLKMVGLAVLALLSSS